MSSFSLQDPIAAIATANGRGGVGIIRISFGAANSHAINVAERLTGKKLMPRVATHTQFLSFDGVVVDEGIAIYFPAPNSYTGETVIELQGHGGQVILQLLLHEVLKIGRFIGMRVAEAGEFTKRAYLNDKLNLAQAEAVADLIEASTEEAAKSAARSLRGGLSDEIKKINDVLTDLRVFIEACLDFPEEEFNFIHDTKLFNKIRKVKDDVERLIRKARTGVLLNNGVTVVLTGRPNVGKSSLLNALAEEDVAIVSPEEGTTRDKIQRTIQIQGFPVNVVDTAGLREATDIIEKMGVERALNALNQADCVLHLVDRLEEEYFSEFNFIQSYITNTTNVRFIRVINKIDLHGKLPQYFPLTSSSSKSCYFSEVYLSAKNNCGLNFLRQAILDAVGISNSGQLEESGSTFSARERHIQLLSQAVDHIDSALMILENYSENVELLAEELRLAQRALGEIIGQISSDDLLGEIFSRFCIGK